MSRSHSDAFAHVAWLCGALCGCYPAALASVPRTVPAGTVNAGLTFSTDGRFLTPRVSLAAGLSDRVEASIATQVLDAEAHVKWQAVRDDVELSVSTGIIGGRDQDDVTDENPEPFEQTKFLANRTAVLIGTDADDTGALFAAVSLDTGVCELDFAYEAPSRDELLLIPGVHGGCIIAFSRYVRFVLEGALAMPVGGPGEIDVGYELDPQTRLGPGDLRAALLFGLVFGRQ
jgi:hypothetical protein